MTANCLASSATRSSIFRPISWWTISRPLNMIVTFTFSPASRNCFNPLNFVWKSCSATFGRSFISFSLMTFCLRRWSFSRLMVSNL